MLKIVDPGDERVVLSHNDASLQASHLDASGNMTAYDIDLANNDGVAGRLKLLMSLAATALITVLDPRIWIPNS